MKTMKMNKWAVACGLLAIAGLASAAIPVLPDNAPMTSTLLARHGADDPIPEPCDAHGTDVCATGAAGAMLARHGADDPIPEPCDDHGTDVCATGAAGA